jgi:putative ABC transport system substrate-binding protein
LEKFKIVPHIVEARTRGEYDRAFASLSRERVDGVVLLSDPSVVEHCEIIAQLALAARLPTAFQRRENAAAGGLFSYGGSIPDQYRYAAGYVDRILKEARPDELPVEQPTKFQLVVNVKTAKALSISISPALLARADEVIE